MKYLAQGRFLYPALVASLLCHLGNAANGLLAPGTQLMNTCHRSYFGCSCIAVEGEKKINLLSSIWFDNWEQGLVQGIWSYQNKNIRKKTLKQLLFVALMQAGIPGTHVPWDVLCDQEFCCLLMGFTTFQGTPGTYSTVFLWYCFSFRGKQVSDRIPENIFDYGWYVQNDLEAVLKFSFIESI